MQPIEECEDIIPLADELEVGINPDNNTCEPGSTICIIIGNGWVIGGGWEIC